MLAARFALHAALLIGFLLKLADGRIVLLLATAIADCCCLEWNRRGKVRSASLWFLLTGMACAGLALHFFAEYHVAASEAAFPLLALYVVASGFLLDRSAPYGIAVMSIGILVEQGIRLSAFTVYGFYPALILTALPVGMLVLLAWISSMGAGSMETAIVRANRADEMEQKYVREAAAYTRLTEDHHEMKSEKYALANANAELIAIQAELAAQYKALEEMNRQLASQATTDGMTGLANHRAFQEELQRQAARSQRASASLSLLLMDVDKFKQYNDAFGHPAGDDVLRTVAQILASQVREGDLPARYGGEEFAVVLPETDAETAKHIAERIRSAVESHDFPNRAVTVSIGVAQHFLTETVAATIERADVALYEAKAAGRNAVIYIPLALTNERHSESPEAAEAKSDYSDETDVQTSEILLLAELEDWKDAPYVVGSLSDASLMTGGIEGLLQYPVAEILNALLEAMDRRGVEPSGHSERITRYALRLALSLNDIYEEERQARPLLPYLDPGDLSALAFGALLHDIGKTGIADSLLRKRGQLTQDEWRQMRRHPLVGAEMLTGHPLLSRALPVVRYHHERWDGAGYPQGLAGEAIPLVARIFAVCDTLETLTSERPYRSKMDYTQARAEIAEGAGTQFDPDVVAAFLRVPEEQWLLLGEGHEELLRELPKAA